MLKVIAVSALSLIFLSGCFHQEVKPNNVMNKEMKKNINDSERKHYKVKPKLSHSFYY